MKYNFISKKPSEVLLIKNSKNGKSYDIQHGGVACLHRKGKGEIVGSFITKYKYFNPKVWYNRTCWLDSIGWIAFFKNKRQAAQFYNLAKKLDKECDRKALLLLIKNAEHPQNVLQNILKFASKKLNATITFDGYYAIFGTDWWEALIPVSFNGQPGYTLTWENCD